MSRRPGSSGVTQRTSIAWAWTFPRTRDVTPRLPVSSGGSRRRAVPGRSAAAWTTRTPGAERAAPRPGGRPAGDGCRPQGRRWSAPKLVCTEAVLHRCASAPKLFCTEHTEALEPFQPWVLSAGRPRGEIGRGGTPWGVPPGCPADRAGPLPGQTLRE
ncbi:hypothetical protein GCM10020295_57640 [Streptomyces cinereospinus]